ncbi:MAG: sigma-70 family RNA polymerase sigma factor [Chitinivibrionales bacterium]|nr:sigma-70 family RNA polymerase sigma factor [Chitinivibrionales bacterium]
MSSTKIKELYEKYGFLIYGQCRAILKSEDDAKDALQVVFMQLMSKYHTISDKSKVIPWIYNTAKNHCFNVLRFRKKFDTADIALLKSDSEKIDDLFCKKEIITLVLSQYNKNIRDAVYLTYVEGFNQEEIRKITGQSPATIRRNLGRFKKKLPHILKRIQSE